jgi:hypothetical protein
MEGCNSARNSRTFYQFKENLKETNYRNKALTAEFFTSSKLEAWFS